MISLRNISVKFGETFAVQDVSVAAEPGEFIALVGPNGSGKSSFLKSAAGLIPHEGSSNLASNRRIRAKQLAYLAQNATASGEHKIQNIVALGRTPHIGSLSRLTDVDSQIVKAAMEKCGVTKFKDRVFKTLSGGEQTRVHLARTLATDTALLLADEPVTALDPYYQLSVMEVLREASNEGTTVIAALHDLSLARKFCDRVWVMNSGRLVADGPPDETLTPKVLREVFRITPEGEIAR